MKPFRAYWPDRIPQLGTCIVREIDFENKRLSITNGCVRVFPDLEQVKLFRPTYIVDVEGNDIYEEDLVQDETTLYSVVWNDCQAGFWLRPLKSRVKEDEILMVLNGGPLGNGYHSRKDLKIVGNTYEEKYKTLTLAGLKNNYE